MDRHLVFQRLHKFRDLGGYAAGGGLAVRWGRLYRSDSLGKLRDDDWDRFLALGVRTVVDLRYPWEIEWRGRIPQHPSFAYLNLSVEHRPYDQARLGPEVAVGPYLAERYLEVAQDGVVELRRALEVIADDDSGPLVFHCASGKDRTGLLAALVLALLGVDDDTIVADFELTELARDGLVAEWLASDPGRELAWPPHFGRAPGEAMRLFLDGVRSRYGSLTGYAAGRLGVDDALLGALRRNLLEPAPAAVTGG
ncbi:tyrosine-protein phosphatase [Streptomyces thermolilacinus]|uniref:protein-tyrosine-phosphatase n=1 Tax=Streptomyces thermolilacinus SPC6 TaxID=1306406 RepID=A0A1D3DZ17_9ACTN|nr:tyrosine-protein phosphatase [Streptomyces thermolilacinus]OEJ97573.1 protein tyrosine phosphatase [Streptomyces thermolilacinus SPC6]